MKNKTHVKINKLKITQIIASLQEVECRQLKLWLESPAHNRRPEVLQLFEELVQAIHYLGVEPNAESIHKRIFPKLAYQAQRLRQHCHYLLRATEAWLSHSSKEAAIDLSLLQTYRERQLGKLFEQTYRRFLAALEQQPYRNAEYYLQRWELARERYAWDSTRGRTAELNLEEQERFLQIATLGLKLRQACLTKAEQQVSNQQIEVPMLAEINRQAQQDQYQTIPMLQVYTLALTLYNPQPSEVSFQAFTNAFDQQAYIFPAPEARDLLLLGINYGIRRINAGQEQYLRACLTLFQRGLANALLLEQNRLDALTYNNIAGIAIRLGELEWAIDFLDSYRPKLDARSREAVYSLNRARIAYTQRDYKTALQLLSTVNDRDLIHQMSARILQLKIYVDTEEVDFALNHIRNTRTYLKRRKNKGYHAQNYTNILRLTEAWCKLPPYDRKALQDWYGQVQETTPLTEREWLLQLG
ncbi:MAG: hypothetical protein AAFN81_10950 [Bacteroidota bacterium]